MTIEIDVARALELLEQVTVGQLDFVYKGDQREAGILTGCAYVEDGRCSCLIAHVLNRAGATLDQLRYLEDPDEQGGIDYSIEGVDLPEGLEITPDARRVLGGAQVAQDGGRTWGVAFRNAKSLAAELDEEAP